MALEREDQGKWPRVIPVLIDDVKIPDPLRERSYVDLRQNYEAELNKIIGAIHSGSGKDFLAHLVATSGIFGPVPFEGMASETIPDEEADG